MELGSSFSVVVFFELQTEPLSYLIKGKRYIFLVAHKFVLMQHSKESSPEDDGLCKKHTFHKIYVLVVSYV